MFYGQNCFTINFIKLSRKNKNLVLSRLTFNQVTGQKSLGRLIARHRKKIRKTDLRLLRLTCTTYIAAHAHANAQPINRIRKQTHTQKIIAFRRPQDALGKYNTKILNCVKD